MVRVGFVFWASVVCRCSSTLAADVVWWLSVVGGVFVYVWCWGLGLRLRGVFVPWVGCALVVVCLGLCVVLMRLVLRGVVAGCLGVVGSGELLWCFRGVGGVGWCSGLWALWFVSSCCSVWVLPLLSCLMAAFCGGSVVVCGVFFGLVAWLSRCRGRVCGWVSYLRGGGHWLVC